MSKKIPLLLSAPGYDLAAPVYDQQEKYLNSFERGKIVSLLGELQGKSVLDVGAGTGRLALVLAERGAHVTALDTSRKMLEVLKRKSSHIATVQGNAESLPFPAASFDIVTAAFLIVHIKNPRIFFDEVYRVLKPGGIFLVTNINQKDPPEITAPTGTIKIVSYYHRRAAVREFLEELAFTIETEELIFEHEVWINQILVARS